MKKFTLLIASLFFAIGAMAQTPVVCIDEIGAAPYKLSDEDAAKIFELNNLTVVLDVTTASSLSDRGAFFCVADPAQSVPASFSGTNTSYMACGHNGSAIAYIAAANSGQHFSSGTIPANSTIRIAYIFDKTNNKFKSYIGNTNTSWTLDRNFGTYEIATPKMVKEDFENANIYIGGGMANNTAHELGDATIHKVRIYDATLTIDEIKKLDYIKEVSDFKNGEIYTFVTERGWMGAKEDNNNVISTAKTSHNLTGSKDNVNFQWTVYKSENGNYYLYNIGKDMFMGVQASNNSSVPFAVSPVGKNLTFKKSSSTEYPIMFSTNNAAVVNHSTDKGDGCISWTDGWGTLNDAGSNHKVEAVGKVTDEVLAKIEKLVAVREIEYFRFKGHSGNYIDASSIYNSATAKVGQMSMKSDEDCNLSGTIFYFDDNAKFLNYATGTYIRVTREIGDISNNDANTWTYYLSDAEGKFKIYSSLGYWLHDNSGNRADRCSVESDHGSTTHSWTLEKIKALPVTITNAQYATFFAPVEVTVPDGVEAYYVTADGVNGTYISLTKIDNGVVPANTGVILYAEEGAYDLEITSTGAAAITGNLLRGTAAATYVTDDAYILAKNANNEAYLGKATKNQSNNSAWKNNSHKAYLPASAVPAAAQASNGFRFGEGTTGIDEITDNRVQSTVIYDLTGRRVEAITAPGIYIVGGKKVLVK